MDQFSFHGPFAYRWINDVPVERIDLRSGERRPIEVISGAGSAAHPADPPVNPMPLGGEAHPDGPPEDNQWRAAMAAWN
jgi:hypothetical protein